MKKNSTSYIPNLRKIKGNLKQELTDRAHPNGNFCYEGTFTTNVNNNTSKKEIRKIIKDVIVCYCNRKDYERKYNWEQMQYVD